MDFMVWKMHKIYEQIFKIGMMDFLSYNFFSHMFRGVSRIFFYQRQNKLLRGYKIFFIRGRNI